MEFEGNRLTHVADAVSEFFHMYAGEGTTVNVGGSAGLLNDLIMIHAGCMHLFF